MNTFAARIFRGSSILSLRDIVVRGFEIVRILLITRLFTVEEFGLYGLAIGTATLLGIFVMPQFSLALQRFYPEYRKKDESKAQDFIFTTFFYTFFNATLIALMAYGLSELIAVSYYQKPELLFYLKTGLCLLLVQPLSELITATLSSLEKFKALFWADILQSLMSTLGVVTIGLWGGTVNTLIFTLVISLGVRILFCGYVLRKNIRFSSPRFEAPVLKFWRPLILSNFFKGITGDLPTLILGRLLTAVELGLFQIADKTIKMIFGLLDPLVNTVSVVCLNAYEEARNEFRVLLNQYFKIIGLAFMFMIGLSMLIAKPLFAYLYGPSYEAAVPIFLVLCLYPLFGGLLFYQRIIYSVTHQTQHYLYFVILSAVFQIPLMLGLTLVYDLEGAAFSMIASRFIALLLAWKLTHQVMKENVQFASLLLPFVMSIFLYTLIYKFLPDTLWQSMIGGILYAVFFWGILVLTRQVRVRLDTLKGLIIR